MGQSPNSFSRSSLRMYGQQTLPGGSPTCLFSWEGTGWRLDKQTTNRDKQGLQSLEDAKTRAHSGHVPGPQQQTTCQGPPSIAWAPAGTLVLSLPALAWPTSPASSRSLPFFPPTPGSPQAPEAPHPSTPARPHPIPPAPPALCPYGSRSKQCPPGPLLAWKNVHASFQCELRPLLPL